MLKVLTIEDALRWDEIVCSFPDADVYWLSGYASAFRLNGDGEPLLFCYEEDGSRAMNVVMKRDIAQDARFSGELPVGRYFDFVTPYGYGGWVIEGDAPQRLREEYTQWCRENGIVCEFIRFHLFGNENRLSSYYGEIRKALNNVVVPTSMPYDALWKDYEHKVRKNVKKAIENHLELIIEQNLDHIDDFLKIYYDTMARNNAKRYFYFSRAFFETIAEKLPENYQFYYVLKDGKVISTELVLLSAHRAYSFLGGTDAEYYAVRPNDFLKDAVIRMCTETKRSYFVLGGGYGESDGIYRYKRSFTKQPDVPYYVGTAVFLNDVYQQLTEIRMKQPEPPEPTSNFFPRYRA